MSTRTTRSKIITLALLFCNMARTRSMTTNSNGNVSRTLKSATKKTAPKPKTSKYFSTTASKTRNEVLSSSSKRFVTQNITVERTESFQPVTHRSFHPDSKVQIHTLLLGTHPSIKSLEESQYFGHPMK